MFSSCRTPCRRTFCRRLWHFSVPREPKVWRGDGSGGRSSPTGKGLAGIVRAPSGQRSGCNSSLQIAGRCSICSAEVRGERPTRTRRTWFSLTESALSSWSKPVPYETARHRGGVMNRELSQLETYLVHEFIEDYVDGIMSRRDMMCWVLRITGGVAATATVLTQFGVQSASAQDGTPAPPPTPTGPRSTESVAEDDPRITGSEVTFPGLDGAEIIAYQAMPSSGDGPFPVVLIAHDNRGLPPHIQDVTRRWAAL